MSLVNGGYSRSDVLELCTQIHSPRFHHGVRYPSRLSCYAKVAVDDEEQKPQSLGKGFPIRVPTMPKVADMEAARRLLEAAFQTLPFEMPKLSIPKRVFIFDITWFVETRFGRPQKNTQDTAPDQCQYPRCAWPRMSKRALLEDPSLGNMLTSESLQEYGNGSDLLLESTSIYPRSSWPRAAIPSKKAGFSNEAGLDDEVVSDTSGASLSRMMSYKEHVGPHCPWPRNARQVTNSGTPSISEPAQKTLNSNGTLSGRSACGNGVAGTGVQPTEGSNIEYGWWLKEDVPCIVDHGGPRCAWPRKSIRAKQSNSVEASVDLMDKVPRDVSEPEDGTDSKLSLSSDNDGAAALPRRMLATSVGLTVMNQLARGSFMASSLIDSCSLLPAGPLELVEEEEDAALDLGRRALLIFLKNSTG